MSSLTTAMANDHASAPGRCRLSQDPRLHLLPIGRFNLSASEALTLVVEESALILLLIDPCGQLAFLLRKKLSADPRASAHRYLVFFPLTVLVPRLPKPTPGAGRCRECNQAATAHAQHRPHS